MQRVSFSVIILLAFLANACQPASTPASPAPKAGAMRVLAVESFLGDISQNVAGDRLQVETLIPIGLDPHAFEPVPSDLERIARAQILIVNGAGFESWLDETLANAGGKQQVIVASEGLIPREHEEDLGTEEHPGESTDKDHPHEFDPHFWFDPLLTIRYVENIRDGFILGDPAGKDIYTQNAQTYIEQLNELDRWAKERISLITPGKRLIVTNHESFGYFSDRYGFRIVGAVLPSVTSGAAPSAQQLAGLVEKMNRSGAHVIFLETGSNPEIAQQIAAETGALIVTDLYTHSLSPANGPASTYLDMMRYNITAIVKALK